MNALIASEINSETGANPPAPGNGKEKPTPNGTSKSKSEKQKNWEYIQGPKGEPGDAFSGAYGAWHFTGKKSAAEQPIPFEIDNIPNQTPTISNDKGVFHLPSSGIYMVNFGVMSNDSKDSYELQLSPDGKSFTFVTIPGTKLNAATKNMSSLSTILYAPHETNYICLKNATPKGTYGSKESEMGTGINPVTAYITIMQIK